MQRKTAAESCERESIKVKWEGEGESLKDKCADLEEKVMRLSQESEASKETLELCKVSFRERLSEQSILAAPCYMPGACYTAMEKAKATMSSKITETEGAGKEEDWALREVQSRIKQREGTEQKLEQKIGKEENMVKGAEPEKTQDEKNHQTLVQKQQEAEKQKADLMALFMECKRSGSVVSPRYEALLLLSAAAKAKWSWAGAWRGGVAKRDNPTNAAKDLENANALVEKYKEDFEKANSKLTKLENEHTQLKREWEEQDMELKRLECTGAELDVVKEKAADTETKTLQKIDNEAKLNNCITSLEG